MQRSMSELESTFQVFVATRSQRAAADKMEGKEATAKKLSGSDQPPNAKPQGGLAGKQARTRGAPGTSALKGTRGGGRKQEEVEAEDNAERVPDEQLERHKKEDPPIFGEEMICEKLGHTEIRKAQQMVERCSRAGASKDKRASKFMIIDGAI